ncbi:MAG: GNAT family N-acetyltransferase [Chloroflexota bacterium]
MTIVVPYTLTLDGFDSLAPSWSGLLPRCKGNSVFLTPQWQQAWWRHFGTGEPLLLSVCQQGKLAGVAPLMRTPDGLSLLGSSDVCDYLDFIAPPEHADGVCQAVLGFVHSLEWKRFDLFSLPEGSVALEHFLPLATGRGYEVRVEQEDVCPRLDLPQRWEDYLSLLAKKDRHELRRKQRRLVKEPGAACEVMPGGETLGRDMGSFLALFRDSQTRKAEFLTPPMSAFFKDIALVASQMGWLRLSFLSIAGARVSTVLGFDYGDTFYMYNSGYDQRYSHLSVGLLLKAQCIQQSIASGKRRFDFLRGREAYKYDLGGLDRPVYRCSITRS